MQASAGRSRPRGRPPTWPSRPAGGQRAEAALRGRGEPRPRSAAFRPRVGGRGPADGTSRCSRWPAVDERRPRRHGPSETPATCAEALDGLDATGPSAATPAESLDFVDQSARLPLVIGFVLLLTLLMMGVTFRSVPLALISTVLNLASVGVAFGLMTLVFQHGWASDAARLHQPGLRRRLAAAVRAGGPGRAVDGLPRVRAQPDP